MDGRGWEVWGWVANGYIAGLVFTVYLYMDCTGSRVSVGGAGLCRLYL